MPHYLGQILAVGITFAAASLAVAGALRWGIVAPAAEGTAAADTRAASPDGIAGRMVLPETTRDRTAAVCPDTSSLLQTTVPAYEAGGRYGDRVASVAAAYGAAGESPIPFFQDYSVEGDYLNYGSVLDYNPTHDFTFDGDGIPMLRLGGNLYYAPVNLGQVALWRYGRYLRGMEPATEFLKLADFLTGLQDERGAFLYPYPFGYYLTGELFEPGWTSGMAQGVGMSVLARAFLVTGDPKYREAGDRALAFLTTPAGLGGPQNTLWALDLSLGGYTTLEEFPSHPPYYTLNGFMFTMLGLYDWEQLDPAAGTTAATAREWFDRSLVTLLYTLPYYDAGGFSTYDLGHVIAGASPNLQPEYHLIHVYLLHALHSITGVDRLKCFERLWHAYVEP